MLDAAIYLLKIISGLLLVKKIVLLIKLTPDLFVTVSILLPIVLSNI
jgi:hypothetical protein